MFFNFLKKTSIYVILTFLILPLSVFAYSDEVIPGGENIGIELNSKGIMIVGFYKVGTSYIAKDSGLKIGDVIVSINNEDVSNIDEMVMKIDNSKTDKITIGYINNGISKTTTMKLTKEANIYKTGLYVKDSITGIGTLTFIDPNTKLYGALGHEIVEKTTGKILEIKNGKIFDTSVTNIERSENGSPGEKNALFYENNVKGTVNENTNHGIFGNYTGKLPNKKTYKVASINDIKLGNAKIRTVLNKSEIKEYDISILSLSKNTKQKTKNILFKITDQKLLAKTGGIIQGMSGSPIIQGNYIIGAVTHVVVDNPTKGYGISIINMLEEAEN